MRKILLSLLTIALVSTVAVSATRAYFTDTATSQNNQLSTGTLSFLLAGDGGESSAYFDVSGLYPGAPSVSKCVEVKNNGDLGMLFRFYVDNYTDSKSLADALDVVVTLRPSTDCATPVDFDAYGPVDAEVYNGKLSGLLGEGNAKSNEQAYFDNDDPLWRGFAAVYKVTVSLPLGAGTEYQDATFTGDLRVDATQAEGQAEGAVVW